MLVRNKNIPVKGERIGTFIKVLELEK